MSRIIALGDIHGCSVALATLIEVIAPQPEDTLVPLGDYVNRGPDSAGVLELLLSLEQRCRLIPLLGNHEEMLLSALRHSLAEGVVSSSDEILPQRHLEFLGRCRTFYETDTHIFVHANYRPELPLDSTDLHTLRWLSLRDYVPPERHCSGKTVVMGHTPQEEVLDLGYLHCIDTGCWKDDWLTALDVGNRQVWQTNQQGQRRTS